MNLIALDLLALYPVQKKGVFNSKKYIYFG